MGVPFIKKTGFIRTFDKDKQPNGYLDLLVNEHDEDEEPIEQAYLTTCYAGEIKGPHMHKGTKCDRFYCVRGSCVLVCRDEDTKKIYEFKMRAYDTNIVYVPPFTSHGIVSKYDATLLSLTTSGFKKDQPYNQVETIYEGYDWDQWLKL